MQTVNLDHAWRGQWRRRGVLALVWGTLALAGCRSNGKPDPVDASPGIDLSKNPPAPSPDAAPPDESPAGTGGTASAEVGSPAPEVEDAQTPPPPPPPSDVLPPPVLDAAVAQDTVSDAAADAGSPAVMNVAGCSDLFRQDRVPTYSVEISPVEWAKMVAEFADVAAVQNDSPFPYHPAIFHFENETVTNASIKLRGQSSWRDTVTQDGARAKMQFTISFKEQVRGTKFHGIPKLTLDMPRSDWSFMHDRVAHTWLRQIGIMSPCANNARLLINGQLYGLYVAEGSVNDALVKEFFPRNPDGDLWKGGEDAETNETTANRDRLHRFKDARDITSLRAVVDLPGSVATWAAEAMLNNADGIYGGSHNFYAYDQGAAGFLYLPQDTDATLDWLAVFEPPAGIEDHPIFWWETREPPAPVPASHYLIVMNDPAARAQYVDAIAATLTKWDPAQLLGWIDTWSAQIAADVALDPHTWATPANFETAISLARDVVKGRPQYLQRFVDCARGGAGADEDADGVKWCLDCRDKNPAVHPGAAEICGNLIDDDCDGVVDDGCPGVVPQ
jgi:hypothetical protein